MSCDGTVPRLCCGSVEMDYPIYQVAVIRCALAGFKEWDVTGADLTKRYRKVTLEYVCHGETYTLEEVVLDGVVVETSATKSTYWDFVWAYFGGDFGTPTYTPTTCGAVIKNYEYNPPTPPYPPIDPPPGGWGSDYSAGAETGTMTITISEAFDYSAIHTTLETAIAAIDWDDVPVPDYDTSLSLSAARFWRYKPNSATLVDDWGGSDHWYIIPRAIYQHYGTGTYGRYWFSWPPPFTLSSSAPTWTETAPSYDALSPSGVTVGGAVERVEISKVKARWPQVACKRWATPEYDDTTTLQCDASVGSPASNAAAGVIMLPYIVDLTTQTEGFVWFADDPSPPSCCT